MTTTQTTDRGSAALASARESVAARATALDELRTDVREDLAMLGRAGLFDAALQESGTADLVQVIDTIAAESLAVGFSTWAHAMTLLYLQRASAGLREEYVDALRTGSRVGVTAMAPALKQLAGLGDMPVIADESGGMVRVTGSIPWASNLFDNAVIVLPARSISGGTYVVAVDAHTTGLTINPAPALMALGATASTSVNLHDVEVPRTHIISRDLGEFVKRFRPMLLLLQTAFALGVGRASLDAARQFTGPLTAPFADDLAALSRQMTKLGDLLYAVGGEPPHRPIKDIIQLRLDTGAAAVSATRLEFTLAGASGYRSGTATNRRFREAAFLPIQAPSEGQLRRELQLFHQQSQRCAR
ncbi:acyl-CoA dehydrogenase [Mycobacterium sp. NPDC048908]|uniref:acyl-CoA dehydrogenase n=1 Tax=Mycobacterium sp. NPDC048908 TaxID=3364292 RepID=UPI0037161785